MVTKILVDSDIESGRRLLEKLDEEGMKVDAALWAYDPETHRYQFIIGSGEVEERGARPFYTGIQHALESLPDEEKQVSFSDVAVTSLSTSVVGSLSTRINTPSNAIESIRITDEVVDREVIDDAYVYRLHVANNDANR